jgi:hypothetical protein
VSTDAMLEDLLGLLNSKTRDGALEWVAQAQDRFVLEVTAGTVLLASSSNVLALNVYPTTTSTLGTVIELAVFNPNGVEVASLQSTDVDPNEQLRALFASVRDQALGADKVIADVIKELTGKTQERRARRSS